MDHHSVYLTKGLQTSLAEYQANTERHSLELFKLRLNVETAGFLSSSSPSSTIRYRRISLRIVIKCSLVPN